MGNFTFVGFPYRAYVNNNPLTRVDPSGFDDTGILELLVTAGGGPENPITDFLAGAVEVASDLGLGHFFSSLFGGGPHLSAQQQSFVNHGGNLNVSLPPITVTGSSGAFSSTSVAGIASQFAGPIGVSALADTAGVDPDMIRNIQVGTTPSMSPGTELDTIHVSATALHSFNWANLAPGWSFAMCAYYGCTGGHWLLAGIGVIPFGGVESGSVTITREGLQTVTTHLAQFGEYAPNQAMIDRLTSQLGMQVTGADANFCTHEILEAGHMASGLGHDAAHAAALAEAGVSPFSLYHPEVIQMFPEYFNNAWRAFWGL